MSGVYIVEFDIYPGLYKIGKSKNIENRVKQFQNSTILLNDGVKLLYYKEFENYTKAERDIHSLLKEYRCKDNKEFFKGDIQYFINIIDSLNSDDYRVEDKEEQKDTTIALSNTAMIYLLRMQVDQMNKRIYILEERERMLYTCCKELIPIIKELANRCVKNEKS